MTPHDKREKTPSPKPKGPYERPELKKIGKLRDVTAQVSTDLDPG